jgi:hypothetical protein
VVLMWCAIVATLTWLACGAMRMANCLICSLYVALNSSSCTAGFLLRMVLIRRTVQVQPQVHNHIQTKAHTQTDISIGMRTQGPAAPHTIASGPVRFSDVCNCMSSMMRTVAMLLG